MENVGGWGGGGWGGDSVPHPHLLREDAYNISQSEAIRSGLLIFMFLKRQLKVSVQKLYSWKEGQVDQRYLVPSLV